MSHMSFTSKTCVFRFYVEKKVLLEKMVGERLATNNPSQYLRPCYIVETLHSKEKYSLLYEIYTKLNK